MTEACDCISSLVEFVTPLVVNVIHTNDERLLGGRIEGSFSFAFEKVQMLQKRTPTNASSVMNVKIKLQMHDFAIRTARTQHAMRTTGELDLSIEVTLAPGELPIIQVSDINLSSKRLVNWTRKHALYARLGRVIVSTGIGYLTLLGAINNSIEKKMRRVAHKMATQQALQTQAEGEIDEKEQAEMTYLLQVAFARRRRSATLNSTSCEDLGQDNCLAFALRLLDALLLRKLKKPFEKLRIQRVETSILRCSRCVDTDALKLVLMVALVRERETATVDLPLLIERNVVAPCPFVTISVVPEELKVNVRGSNAFMDRLLGPMTEKAIRFFMLTIEPSTQLYSSACDPH